MVLIQLLLLGWRVHIELHVTVMIQAILQAVVFLVLLATTATRSISSCSHRSMTRSVDLHVAVSAACSNGKGTTGHLATCLRGPSSLRHCDSEASHS